MVEDWMRVVADLSLTANIGLNLTGQRAFKESNSR